MADEFASLADTVVTPSAEPKTTTHDEPPKAAAEEPKVSSEFTANPDAAELGQILLNSGYSKEQLNDLLQAPKTLEAIQHQLRNDPVEFFKTIERNDPRVGEKIFEDMADEYVKRYGRKAGADDGDDKGKKGAVDSGLAAQIQSLQERLDKQETERQQERNAAALATTRQRYQGRVDDLFGLKEVKELGLTKAESKAMRAALDVELGKDQAATQRIINGNFVDVPRTFKLIIDEWAADKKATADAATKGRESVMSEGFNEFTTGAELVSKLPANTFDSWDNTEEAFAKTLERTR